MFLILPSNEGQEEFETLEKKLLTLDFQDIFDRMGVVFGDILLPRMELKFSTNLGSYLSTIGKYLENSHHIFTHHPKDLKWKTHPEFLLLQE